MSSETNRWAQWRFGWGVAFAIASVLLLIWLLPLMVPGTPADALPTASATPTSGLRPDVAAAQATLDAARTGPAPIGDVVAAANTVVAATAEPVGTPRPGSPSPVPTSMTGEPPAATPGTPLFTRVVDTIPALTAIVTFLGLVFTSLMKWRSDLPDTERQELLLEQQRLSFMLEQERHELEQARALFDLERRRFQLEVDRKQFELNQMEARLLEQKDN